MCACTVCKKPNTVERITRQMPPPLRQVVEEAREERRRPWAAISAGDSGRSRSGTTYQRRLPPLKTDGRDGDASEASGRTCLNETEQTLLQVLSLSKKERDRNDPNLYIK